MAKCKYFGKRVCPRDKKDWCYFARKGSVTDNCDIIIPKKPKTKSVRAWAWIEDGCFIGANKSGKIAMYDTPCTITYRVKGAKP